MTLLTKETVNEYGLTGEGLTSLRNEFAVIRQSLDEDRRTSEDRDELLTRGREVITDLQVEYPMGLGPYEPEDERDPNGTDNYERFLEAIAYFDIAREDQGGIDVSTQRLTLQAADGDWSKVREWCSPRKQVGEAKY